MQTIIMQFIVDLMVWAAVWATISAFIASFWLQMLAATIVLIVQIVAREEGWDYTELTTLRSAYRKARPHIIDAADATKQAASKAAKSISNSASDSWNWLTKKVRSKRAEPGTVMAHESKHMTADGLIVTIRDFRHS